MFIMQQEDYITVPEYAKRVGLSRSQVFRIVQSGEIRSRKFGRMYLIPVEELNKITGNFSAEDTDLVAKGVKKVISEYGEVIRDLGDK